MFTESFTFPYIQCELLILGLNTSNCPHSNKPRYPHSSCHIIKNDCTWYYRTTFLKIFRTISFHPGICLSESINFLLIEQFSSVICLLHLTFQCNRHINIVHFKMGAQNMQKTYNEFSLPQLRENGTTISLSKNINIKSLWHIKAKVILIIYIPKTRQL